MSEPLLPPLGDPPPDASLADLEVAEHYRLRLFVAGLSPRSQRAMTAITEVCEAHLAGRYTLEIIDIYQHPELAKSDQIVAVPTLLRHLPPPLRKIIGDLTDRERLFVGLDIAPHRPTAGVGDRHDPRG